MPIRAPRSIRIRGKVWTVRKKSELSGKLLDEIRGCHGVCYDAAENSPKWMPQREIHVEDDAAAEWLVHELLHACSSGAVTSSAEEKFIRDVQRPLVEVMRQLRVSKGER